MEEPATFGSWLKLRRRALDLTRQDLAGRVGCSTETIRKLEVGRRRPSKQVALLLAHSLAIPPEEQPDFLSFARSVPDAGPQAPDVTPPVANGLGQAPSTPWHARPLVPMTPLIGRQQAVTDICSLLLGLDQEAARLLTLTGPPGIGKTRLGLQVQAELAAHFPDGTFFVQLASLTDPDLVLSTIAGALGLTESGAHDTRSPYEIVTEHVQGRRMLIVLDNFEQVVGAAAQVSELLVVSPELRMLVTSRELLRVRGEHQYRVLPLALPDLQALPAVNSLLSYPAVTLFVERAKAAEPGFTLTEDNASAVAAICARLDGLPLGIELIAARTRLLSPQALLARLNSHLLLSTPGPRDLPSRHHTLSDAINSSYRLLSEAEQLLFTRLAVFTGGCALSAAEAVCSSALPLDLLDGMTSLADKSLLLRVAPADDEPRFTMLETIREYAQQRLASSGEESVIRRGHAEYIAALVEEADPQIRGVNQQRWLEKLEQEQANIRAALGWSLQQRHGTLAARLAGSLWRFWEVRGHVTEGLGWLGRVLAEPDLPAPLKASALNAAGVLARNQGDTARARAVYEESLALYRALNDQQGIAGAANNLAVVMVDLGELDRARTLFEENLAVRRALGDTRGAGIALSNLGGLALRRRDYGQAMAPIEESLALFRELGDKRASAAVLDNLAAIVVHEGDHPRARALYAEMLELLRGLGDRSGVAIGLEGMAAVELAQGHAGSARSALMLLGASHALREATSSHLPPVEQAEYDTLVAAARGMLAEEEFTMAWHEGTAMRMEQAIAYALEAS